jgi:hypothetical protein
LSVVLTLTFPLGALIRFGATFTRPVSSTEIADALPLNVLRGGVWIVAAPIADDEVAGDPSTVRLRVLAPDGVTESTFVYLATADIVRDYVGVFHADIAGAASVAGKWRYRWESTGTGQAAAEAAYIVAASAFP